MRGLVIQSPWIEKILDGQKIWEMRSIATGIRGDVALIKKGSGVIIGVANLTDNKGPLSETDLLDTYDLHQIPEKFWSPYIDFKWRYAWIFSDVKPLPSPVQYLHPPGAVIWVTLNSETIASVQHSFNSKSAVPNSVIKPAQPIRKYFSASEESLQEKPVDDFIRVPRSKSTKKNVLSTLVAFAGHQETTEEVVKIPDKKPGSLYRKKVHQFRPIEFDAGDLLTSEVLSEKSNPPMEQPGQGENYREITLSQGNINNSHIYLRSIKDWLPDSVIGGSNKNDLATEIMTIDWGGSSPAFSDVAGAKMIFRSRKWVRDFFKRYQLKAEDTVSFEKLGHTRLKLRPVKGVARNE